MSSNIRPMAFFKCIKKEPEIAGMECARIAVARMSISRNIRIKSVIIEFLSRVFFIGHLENCLNRILDHVDTCSTELISSISGDHWNLRTASVNKAVYRISCAELAICNWEHSWMVSYKSVVTSKQFSERNLSCFLKTLYTKAFKELFTKLFSLRKIKWIKDIIFCIR